MKKLLVFIVLISLCNCDTKNELPSVTDPQQAILGKWEIIEKGNWPSLESYPPSGYSEYLSDSVVRFFDYNQNQFTSQTNYWIDDRL